MEDEKKEEKPPASEASSVKTEAVEEDEKTKDSKTEAAASTSSEGKIKTEAKASTSTSGEGEGEMDEAAMRRALQVGNKLPNLLEIRNTNN